jgi:uncharacterized membrane protein
MVDTWIRTFYQSLDKIGFSDPIHTMFAHLPIGLIVGALILSWLTIFSGRESLAQSARHCATLAFIFLFPVILFGLTDWEHYYGRAWLAPVKIKIILAGFLFTLLLVVLILGSAGRRITSKFIMPMLYTLCLIDVVLLGWFGARLIYGTNPELTLMPYKSGYAVFEASCKHCHLGGGNIMNVNKPINNSLKLKDMNTFITYIRNPEGNMPPFSAEMIADHQAEELYLYITTVLNKVPQSKE